MSLIRIMYNLKNKNPMVQIFIPTQDENTALIHSYLFKKGRTRGDVGKILAFGGF